MPEIWTLGHSTRTADEFMSVLAAWRIEAIADVRRFPGSRRMPQFGSGALQRLLNAKGLDYQWLPKLGGRRRPRPDSVNSGWRNPSFQGYADHLQTEEFAQGLEELVNLAWARRTALMCSELLWWRCHRSLISDVLRLQGWQITHIADARKGEPHPWTSPARVIDGELSYPPESP